MNSAAAWAEPHIFDYPIEHGPCTANEEKLVRLPCERRDSIASLSAHAHARGAGLPSELFAVTIGGCEDVGAVGHR